MKVEFFNPNPNVKFFSSGKPKAWTYKDSSIRAICKALNKTWDEVYEGLTNLGKQEHNMPDAKEIVNLYLLLNNFSYNTLGKPKQNAKRMILEDFVNIYNTGIYILYLRDYYIAVIDGIVYNTDNKDLDKQAIYSYWKLS